MKRALHYRGSPTARALRIIFQYQISSLTENLSAKRQFVQMLTVDIVASGQRCRICNLRGFNVHRVIKRRGHSKTVKSN